MLHIYSIALGLLLFWAGWSEAEAPVKVFTAGRIHPVDGPAIDKGMLLIQGNKIVGVGPQGSIVIPKGAEVHDYPDAEIIPGLVDTHSHIGLWSRPAVPANADGNEMTGPVQSGLRALDAINPHDAGIKMAVAGGITTANIMPGSGNVIGGQTIYVKLRGNTIDAMRLRDPRTLGGLKMANGENPKGYGRKGQAPFTRMKIASLQREQFVKAREYQKKWQNYRASLKENIKLPSPDRDLALEPLVEVLEGQRTVHFHCHRADDLMTAVRIAEEFQFDLVLQHATEGYRIAEELARRKIPCSLTLVDSPGGKLEVMGLVDENASILEKAGVLIALNTDDFITESRFFLRTGSLAVRGGLSTTAALKALTINAATMLKLDHRIGSLTKGKDADFVIVSGPPFSVYSQVLETYIDGIRQFQRADKRDWTYQAGGFALNDLHKLPDIFPVQRGLPTVKTPVVAENNTLLPGAPAYAIRAGRIHTAAGEPIENGCIIVDHGLIKAVGRAADVPIPPGLPIIAAVEVTPGLIDAHTVCGLSGAYNIPADQDHDETSDPNQADLRVLDGYNPNDPHIEFLRAHGVTIVHAMPGRSVVIAGQTGIFRTSGTTVNSSLIRFPAGILVNLGESSKTQGKFPQTRMASANLVRTALAQARNHAQIPAEKRSRNLKAEALNSLLTGQLPMIISAHRSDDILTGLRLAKEYKLKPILSLATEGYLIADELQEAKVPVIVQPTMQRAGSNMETLNGFTGNAAVLAGKRIPIAIGTAFEGYVPKTRILRTEAAMAAVHGLGRDRALRAVTIDAAGLLGIHKERGSIAPGKAADLVLYDGDPFENATHVVYTICDGKIVFSRSEYLKIPLQRRAFAGSGASACCLGE